MAYSRSTGSLSSQFIAAKLEINIACRPLIGGYYFAKRQAMVTEVNAALIDPWLREHISFFNFFLSISRTTIFPMLPAQT